MNYEEGGIDTASAKIRAPGIVLRRISFAYNGALLFDNLDFTATAGRWTCLLGPSGCGKSTLLRIISGSLTVPGGTVRFQGVDDRKHVAAWMSQKDLLLPWLTVFENVLLGARLRKEVTAAKRSTARSLIAAAGLEGCEQKLPAALSGGMRQRVALLRTLMENRPVILMDEPFSSLDTLTRLRLQNLAADMVAGATVLLVTHDPLEALRLGDAIHVMTGNNPTTIGEALVPKSLPPRHPQDPEVTKLHAALLGRLMGDHAFWG